MNIVGLLDYGAGNFTSVFNALRKVDVDVIRVCSSSQLKDVSHIVLPGVGAFARARQNLEKAGLLDELKKTLDGGEKPFLGICVGMQLLAQEGTEFGSCKGLDVIPGVVERIPVEDGCGLRLPQIGWNHVTVVTECPLFIGLAEQPTFYFVHSYYLNAECREHVLAECDYGVRIVSAVCKGRVFGVQFHPEKSQQDGLRLLKNFAKIPA